MSDDDPDVARDSVDAEMLELLEHDPEAYFRLTHKPFPELATDGDMREFLRSKGFKPGPADGNPPEIWFNGVPYEHPGVFWRDRYRTDWGVVTGPARMSDKIEQLKNDPDAYYQALRDEGEVDG